MSDLGDVEAGSAAYLKLADRVLPGWVTGFYVVGSAALGEFVPGRSDLDFIAVVGHRLGAAGLRRLRLLHDLAAARSIRLAKERHGRYLAGGTPNGGFVLESDLSLPVSQIRPVASHVGYRFSVGKAFDVNPVMWKVLAESGLTIRGAPAPELGLDCQPELLTRWNLDNLDEYWEPWGRKMLACHRRRTLSGLRYGAAWTVAWGALGAPRLHYTIATGQVIGKAAAGRYALDTFDREWHPVIHKGLEWWHRAPGLIATEADVRRTGEFVAHVVASAHQLAASPASIGP